MSDRRDYTKRPVGDRIRGAAIVKCAKCGRHGLAVERSLDGAMVTEVIHVAVYGARGGNHSSKRDSCTL